MATRIDGRTMISDSYAPFGTVPVLPDRPEPKRVEPKLLDKSAVMQRQRWTDANWETAQSRNFPAAMKIIVPGEWGWTLKWRDTDIDRWVDEQRSERNRITELIGK